MEKEELREQQQRKFMEERRKNKALSELLKNMKSEMKSVNVELSIEELNDQTVFCSFLINKKIIFFKKKNEVEKLNLVF